MKVRVSNVFATFINKTAEKYGLEARASVVKFQEATYRAYVGDVDDAYDCGDDAQDGTLRAIVVEFPWDYYACPVYLSTRALRSEFRSRGVRTVDDLEEMIADIFNI